FSPQSAHIPKEAERGPHDVIPLIEVYNKSVCQPREVLVEILQEYPDEVEHIFIPSCVVLRRCAGCCSDEMLQCTPTATRNVTMEIKRIKLQRQQNDVFMSFTEHSACDLFQLADSLKKERVETYRSGRPPCLESVVVPWHHRECRILPGFIHPCEMIVCEPCCDSCTERRKRLFVQDPATCRCSCKHTVEYCRDRQLELNEKTCK
uniref:Vascular endothelial growth factor Ab n=1 Tax=Nothobranchius furzeri TaxID=105023 RepID=A0A8C6NLC3_NOTFU